MRFAPGTFARIRKALGEHKRINEFVRAAVEGELERREAGAHKVKKRPK
jgi:hypothetical protein